MSNILPKSSHARKKPPLHHHTLDCGVSLWFVLRTDTLTLRYTLDGGVSLWFILRTDTLPGDVVARGPGNAATFEQRAALCKTTRDCESTFHCQTPCH